MSITARVRVNGLSEPPTLVELVILVRIGPGTEYVTVLPRYF